MQDYEKNNSKSSKAPLIIIFIIVLVVGGVIVSNYIGPKKGWGDRILKGKKEPIVEPTPVPVKPEPPQPIKVEKQPPKVTEKVEPEKIEKEGKSNIKKLYDSLFSKYKKRFPDPKIGKKYDVYLKSGKTRGKLKHFSDGRIVIQKPGVTVTYRLNIVSKKSYPKLFPKKAAKILALKELKKILEQKAADEEKREQREYAIAKSGASATSIRSHSSATTKFAYDPEPQPTPGRLKKPLASFADWVKVQHRRMGGKIADTIYAKKQGRNIVLYMQTSKLYKKQSYDIRFSVTEGMWQIWGFKCIDYGVARTPNQVHLVLLDKKKRIIGGSTKDDASNIWVKK